MDTSQRIGYGYCGCGCGQRTSLATQTDSRIGHIKGEPVGFVVGHNHRRSPVLYAIEDRGYTTPCWIWRLACVNGYGRWGKEWAYKRMYVQLRGPVPKGLHLDHLCQVRACVNPDHLEPVTPRENRRRGGQERLTSEQVSEIRQRLADGELQRSIAQRYGVTQSHISRISTGVKWRG